MSFYLFRRYFFSSRSGALIKTISWICLAGMAVSVAALILVVSIMGGFGQAIKSRLLSKEAHLVIQFENSPFSGGYFPSQLKNKPLFQELKPNQTDSAGRRPIIGQEQNPAKNKQAVKAGSKQIAEKQNSSLFLDKEEPPIIFSGLTQEQKEGIQSAFVFETQDLILKTSEGFKGIVAVGYSKKQWGKKILQSVVFEQSGDFGHLMAGSDFAGAAGRRNQPFLLQPQSEKEVLISHELSLGAGLFPGDELNLIPPTGLLLPPGLLPPVKTFTVKGVLQNTEKDFAVYYQQGKMDFGDFSKINYRAEIQFKNPDKAPMYQSLFQQHKTQNWMERNSTLFFALKLEKFVMTLFLVLALVISCLGLSSALFLLMTQKVEDLAILNAMGLTQGEITVVFTRLGFFLALMGLLSGAFAGLAGTVFLKYNSWNILPEMYQDRTLPAVFMPLNYFVIVSLALILSWLSCYFPTRYFSRIRPADLLKATAP